MDVETALRRNGFSGEQLLKLAHKAANDALRRAGGGIASPHCRKAPSCGAFLQSGRRDSNSGPLVPQTSALTRLRHAPWPGHPSEHAESSAFASGAPDCLAAEWQRNGNSRGATGRSAGRSLGLDADLSDDPRDLFRAERLSWRRTLEAAAEARGYIDTGSVRDHLGGHSCTLI